MEIDNEWERFMSSDNDNNIENVTINNFDSIDNNNNNSLISDCPEASDIYISTKSMISFLNESINLFDVFWKIPLIEYGKPTNGVIKKQMKFNSTSQNQLDEINDLLKKEQYYTTQIISSIDNPSGRVKFKDTRKINIGISMKDIMSYRVKQKGAFYNCFVMILRININNTYKEFHVKIFNTGKIEIPGVQNDEIHNIILQQILDILTPFTSQSLNYQGIHQTILINSNFNCGFYINREKLHDLLNMKYNIQSIFDPCTYPGIQSKFYYDTSKTIQDGCVPDNIKSENIHKLSFMIFRTGSILIVGRCSETILIEVYHFIKNMLVNEFININQHVINQDNVIIKDKKNKIRKKSIYISSM